MTNCKLRLFFSPQTVGVIVRLERDNFHVLSMQGKVVQAKPQALQKKKESRHAVALDFEQNSIQIRDIVKVIDGPHSVNLNFIYFIYLQYYRCLVIYSLMFYIKIFWDFSRDETERLNTCTETSLSFILGCTWTTVASSSAKRDTCNWLVALNLTLLLH